VPTTKTLSERVGRLGRLANRAGDTDLPLRRVSVRPDAADGWYWSVPAVSALRTGLEFSAPVTVLVGENGSGKSTLLEAIAFAWGRRLTAQVHHWGPAPSAEDAELWRALVLEGEHPPPQGGCFLRAEAMHRHFGAIDADATELRAFDSVPLNARSHGESFLAFAESRRYERGLWLLDEPEAALSFRSCFALLYLLGDAVAAGSQVVLATHSPLLAAFPGASVLALGPDGPAPCPWGELEFVRDWRDFFADPGRWLRHLAE
jgi:predicted ATPase